MKKGDCIIIACQKVLDNPDWLFCYALVSGQGDLKGTRILHAWCENQEFVFDFSNGKEIVVRKEKYYETANIKESDTTRQTIEEISKLMLETGTYGGWIKEPTQIFTEDQ